MAHPIHPFLVEISGQNGPSIRVAPPLSGKPEKNKKQVLQKMPQCDSTSDSSDPDPDPAATTSASASASDY
jgi:hypothetical protein